ncbi:CaiB/BaiF CoA transferase family protein [Arthrobacter sp. NPDC090010]|uniref:CaiB/BaiF CoA transferase family protein n=1 Tax=Arthrobacter sp. NPDC090010 TaxID=3363942 RepID=UPI00382DD824
MSGTNPAQTSDGQPGPLTGTLVVDLSRALAGPHAGMMLGDLGARVIKVENPSGGDDTRGWGPPFIDTAGGRESTYFLSCNRNKESITLDLKDEDDKGVLRELLRRADVLVENFRPGTLDRLGFDPVTLEELNPRLVILSISGFGHDGPEGQRAGYDQIAQGEAGLMSLTGSGPDDPQRVGVPIGDVLAGIHGAYGVLAALLQREQTGRGQVVRTSLLSSIVSVLAFQGTRWTVGGQVPQAQGNHHPSIAPYGLFRCADGAVQIAVGSEGLWKRFADAFGLDRDDPRWDGNAQRVEHRNELIAVIEDAFSAYGSEELLGRLEEAGVPAGKVRTLDEVFAWEQTRSQHLLLGMEHPTLGHLEVPGGPLRYFQPDGTETTRLQHTAPPRLGEHDEGVRAWLDQLLVGRG